ncbi:hypothetical protein MtrunA17_Chr5g0412891 [Medicago truncatula]|uniref:Transmembrane protein n=1 Tax=Medicago truncatula TaxID=3880 RepID=A0A396HR69_MEDTR|nr:hypothetical protein MtrunA17_Chr5g0412891 [Medicago truncatula]
MLQFTQLKKFQLLMAMVVLMLLNEIVRMKDIQGMPDTAGGLSLRIFQFIFAADALSAMAFTSYFPNIKHLPSMSFGERE